MFSFCDKKMKSVLGQIFISIVSLGIQGLLSIEVKATSLSANWEPDPIGKPFKIAEFRSSVLLQCNVTDPLYPSYSIRWFKGESPISESSEKYLIEDNKLIINKVREEDLDEYKCELHYKQNVTIEPTRATINLISKPVIKLPMSTTVVEGEKILLQCLVSGKPVPSVEWRFGNETYNKTEGRITLQEYRNVPNAGLVIDEAKLSDRGTFFCVARNIASGSNSTVSETFVRVKDKLAALWPFLGICAEVFILCAIILIYEKKRNKTELDESDTDQSPEQKNTPDHGKESVRHRK